MSDLSRVWEECWTRVARGEATIEDCVRRYPEYAEDLRRLFAVVVRLSQGRLVRPNEAYKARVRAQMLERIRSHQEMRSHQGTRTDPTVQVTGETGARGENRAQPNGPMPLRGSVIPLVLRLGLALAVVLFLLLVSGTMLAQAALPGDPLYTWKTRSENVFRAVYPDPLTADLILTDRRAEELTRVAGTPAAEHVAQEGYQRVLSELPRYTDPSSQTKIRTQLTQQKTQLQQAGVNVPAIDRALNSLGAAPAITPTPTPSGGASGAGTTPTLRSAPKATLTPNSVLPTKSTTTQTATPTRRPTRTPSPTRRPSLTPTPTQTPRATFAPSPTQKPQTTGEPTPRTPFTETPTPTHTNTPTPTPCASESPAVMLSPAECATPTFDCGTETTNASSCGTPTRTGTPTSTIRSATPSASPTPTQTPTGISEPPNLFDSVLP